ncbi:MAG: flagellar basal body rod protein FlgB [Pseudomonadota bacterium]
MEIKRFTADRLAGKTIDALSRALGYRSAKHNVISGNLANIDTPGYQQKDLVFNEALQRAVERRAVAPAKTNPKHFSHFTGTMGNNGPGYRVTTRNAVKTKTNQFNIDREMSKMVQNNLLFEASARLLTRKFDALRTAIESGRR